MTDRLRAPGAARRARVPAPWSLLWGLFLAALVLAPAPGARAAPVPAPLPTPAGPTAEGQFGVRAGLYGLTTLTGGHFGYALKAGARIEDSAVVCNDSDETRTFHVYGADVTQATGGGLAPAQEGGRMSAVGAWLTLDSGNTVTVRPKGRATVRFSLTVPVGTPPGSYLGSLVTALRTPAVSGGVNTETRIARLVELTVPGTADLQVSLTALRHRPAGDGEEFTVTVRNTGNVLYTFAGTLDITGGGSPHTVPLTPTGIYVIPGGSATLTGRLADLPALGRRTVTASVTATVPGGATKTVRSDPVRLSRFPWLIAALTVTGLLALALLLVRTRTRRRAWLRRRAEERTALRALRRELRAGRPATAEPHEVRSDDAEHSASSDLTSSSRRPIQFRPRPPLSPQNDESASS